MYLITELLFSLSQAVSRLSLQFYFSCMCYILFFPFLSFYSIQVSTVSPSLHPHTTLIFLVIFFIRKWSIYSLLTLYRTSNNLFIALFVFLQFLETTTIKDTKEPSLPPWHFSIYFLYSQSMRHVPLNFC